MSPRRSCTEAGSRTTRARPRTTPGATPDSVADVGILFLLRGRPGQCLRGPCFHHTEGGDALRQRFLAKSSVRRPPDFHQPVGMDIGMGSPHKPLNFIEFQEENIFRRFQQPGGLPNGGPFRSSTGGPCQRHGFAPGAGFRGLPPGSVWLSGHFRKKNRFRGLLLSVINT